jgi:hypothetical protein
MNKGRTISTYVLVAILKKRLGIEHSLLHNPTDPKRQRLRENRAFTSIQLDDPHEHR